MTDKVYVVIANEGSFDCFYTRNVCVVLDEETAMREVTKYQDNINRLIEIRRSKGRSGALTNRLVKEGQELDPEMTDLDLDYDYEEIELR